MTLARARTSSLAALALSLAATACGSGGASPVVTPQAAPPAQAPSAAAPATASAEPERGDPAPEPAPTAAAHATRPTSRAVVLITVDSLRADALYGEDAARVAPNLSALAARSVVYRNAYALSSVTGKSLGGLLAGRYPSELSRSFDFFPLYADDNVFFPEALHDAGVHTAAAHAHHSLRADRGFAQGFTSYELLGGLMSGKAGDAQITGEPLTDLAIATLGRGPSAPDAKRFFWAHYLDPHQAYRRHEGAPAIGEGDRAAYLGEVWYADRAIGRLLAHVASQPWGKDAAIIVTADHGEAFFEHRMGGHAFELWEELIRVPLVVHVPGVDPRRIDATRSHLDIARTVLELLGVPAGPTFRGQSLLADLDGEPAARTVVSDLPEDKQQDRRRVVLDGGLKLHLLGVAEKPRLYDLATDAGETRDRSADLPAELVRMRALAKTVDETARRKRPLDQR